MIVYINIFLLFCGFSALFLGVTFIRRERYARGRFKYIVFMLSMSASMASVGYGIMSLSPNMTVAFFSRDIGVLGILLYLLSEIILVVNNLKISPKLQRAIYIIVPISMFVDMIIFGHPRANRFVRYHDYTSYITNEPARHTYHYTYLTCLIIFMLIIATYWATQQKFKREKLFVLMAFVSNLSLAVSCIPDAIGSSFAIRYPHIPYTLGIIAAYSVFYAAAVKFSAFFITIDSVSENIFTTVNTGLIVFDPTGNLSLINNYACELLGIEADYSMKLSDLFDIKESFEISIYNMATSQISQRYRFTARHSQKRCLVNISAKLDYSNEPLYYLFTVNDLTEENRLIEEAQAANEAKTAFLSNMSHEIRTPINAISGMSEMIIRECKDNEILNYASKIDTASRTLLTLINDVLDFSKIEAGQFEIIPVKYDLGRLIVDCHSLASTRAMEKSQNLNLIVDPNLPAKLKGDEVRIRQILTNLLTNAVKYTPNYGDISLTVTGVFKNDGLDLVIKVADNGIGIKEEDIPNLFENFTRFDLEKNRNIEGTGLGLAIISKLIKLMNGNISVESVYGQGTTFTVVVPQEISGKKPLGDIEKYETEAVNDVESHHYALFEAPTAKILAVDDSPMNIDVFVGLLKHTNIQIDTSLDGYDALEKMQREKYDIIFMDHMMPGINGVQVLEKMKTLGDYPNKKTPVIMLTANAILGSDIEYLRAGFDAYLAKPIKPAQLEELVLRFLPEEKVTMVDSTTNDAPTTTLPAELSDLLDVQLGLEHSVGEADFYHAMLHTFIKEDKRNAMINLFSLEDWDKYRVTVHALKGTSLTIGARELSEHAKGLEFAVKEDRISYILENHEAVLDEYTDLLDKLKKILESN